MNELTFCSFAANDNPDEQTRIDLHLESLLLQDSKEYKVVFFDCSPPGQEFQVPTKIDRLKVVRRPMGKGHEWNRSVIRNEMSLLVDTPMICHICADCYYAPNFASCLIKHMNGHPGDPKWDKILLCLRQCSTEKQWAEIKKNPKIIFDLANIIPYDGPAAYGECQCMWTKQFMEAGGFYSLIKNGKSTWGDWATTAGSDDSTLMSYVLKRNQYKDVQHNIDTIYVSEDKKTWLIHLYHPVREARVEWDAQR